MRRRILASFLIVGLGWPTGLLVARQADSELATGIRQAQIGEFETAVVTLDRVARRLAKEGGRAKELARAYVYLSVAYLGLSQEQKAKARFLEAWKTDQGMELGAKEFPPKVLQFLEEARKEAVATGAPKAKRGAGTKILLFVGLGGAAAAGIALAASRGGEASSAGSITLLSATPPAGSSVQLTNDRFPITLTFSVQSNMNLPEAYFGVQLLRGTGTCSGLADGGGAQPSPLQAGQTRTITVSGFNNPTIPSCFAPGATTAQTDTVRAYVVRATAPNPDRGVAFETRLSAPYTLVR